MRRLALAAVALVALSYDIEAMENKPTTELKIVNETSFCVYDRLKGYTNYEWCENFRNINMKGVNFEYEKYGREHDVDVATLRGDNFQPREFWTQPFKEILHTLYPVIKKHRIINIAYFDTETICFSKDKYCYEFINEVPHTCPEMMEYFFEEDAYDEITEWMKKRGLKPIDWDDYQESLHNHYGAKEPLKIRDPNARKLPLYEYFLPCFS